MSILKGLRVLDMTAITAGGRTTQILADYGADVIKIESPTRPDPFRHWSNVTGEVGSGDLSSPPFRVVGRNKRGIAIDLKDERGVEVMRRLVETADLVVENFRRGVMERLGIGFEQLRRWHPAIALVSISSQGDSGPERDNVSFGGTLEALSGLMSVTGYGPAQPLWTTSKVNYPDQVVALLGPGLALWTVLQCRATGRGMHIDLSQRELSTSLLGDLIAESSISGHPARAHANTGAEFVTACCPCAGDDEWLVITLRSAAEAKALSTATGVNVGYAQGSQEERQRCAENVARAVSAWSSARDKGTAMRELQQAGVPAAAVLRAWELSGEEEQRGESFHVPVPTEDGEEMQVSWPFEMHGQDQPRIIRRAPHLGEHTAAVMAELGYSHDAIDALRRAGVIAASDFVAADSGEVSR